MHLFSWQQNNINSQCAKTQQHKQLCAKTQQHKQLCAVPKVSLRLTRLFNFLSWAKESMTLLTVWGNQFHCQSHKNYCCTRSASQEFYPSLSLASFFDFTDVYSHAFTYCLPLPSSWKAASSSSSKTIIPSCKWIFVLPYYKTEFLEMQMYNAWSVTVSSMVNVITHVCT